VPELSGLADFSYPLFLEVEFVVHGLAPLVSDWLAFAPARLLSNRAFLCSVQTAFGLKLVLSSGTGGVFASQGSGKQGQNRTQIGP
jgi:hypothetical protein